METDIIKANLRDFYNREAGHRNSEEKEDWKIEQREIFLKLILNENKKSLLEIGAGTGQDSLFFIEKGLNVTAIDISSEMVKICKEKKINAYEMDFYELEKLNKKFDCIWSMNSLLHVPKTDLLKVLENINSVMKENGLFYMGVYGGEDTESNWVNDVCDTPRYFSYYSEVKIKEILQKVFKIVSFEQIDVGRNTDFQSVILKKVK